MDYRIIATGSKGNAVLLNDEILLDCGVPYKLLKPYVQRLKLVLLTHIHGDHFNPVTIRALAYNRPTLRFACCGWLAEDCRKHGVVNLDVLQIGRAADYRVFQVVPVKLYHDVPNCGYRVFWGNERMIYATDTVTLEGITAKNYDLYLIEGNYDCTINDRVKNKEANGEYIYEYRVLQTHLSVEDATAWLLENMGENSRYEFIHQHKEEHNVQ